MPSHGASLPQRTNTVHASRIPDGLRVIRPRTFPERLASLHLYRGCFTGKDRHSRSL